MVHITDTYLGFLYSQSISVSFAFHGAMLPLTLFSLDSLCMSSLVDAEDCGWSCMLDCWLDILSRFLRESTLDLKGTIDSWETLGMEALSSIDATPSLLENSTTAYTPWNKINSNTQCFNLEINSGMKVVC